MLSMPVSDHKNSAHDTDGVNAVHCCAMVCRPTAAEWLVYSASVCCVYMSPTTRPPLLCLLQLRVHAVWCFDDI